MKINDILKGPGFFDCEKTSCRMRLDVCLQRQQANLTKPVHKAVPFWQCQDCSQGAKNKRLKEDKDIMFLGEPTEGKGEKNLDCELYGKCLDIASEKKWEAFNCKSCGQFKTESKEPASTIKTDDKKICEKCEDRPVMNKYSKYCSPCLNSFKKTKEKKAASDTRKHEKAGKTANEAAITGPITESLQEPARKKASLDIAEPGKASKTDDTAVLIRFGKYISVYKEVEKLADQEMRPTGLQVAYMLKKQLEIDAKG